jgi:hypothetical protein
VGRITQVEESVLFSFFHVLLVIMSGWETNHCLKTLASSLSLRLVQVCSNLAAKTMRKGRNHPRNPSRNWPVSAILTGLFLQKLLSATPDHSHFNTFCHTLLNATYTIFGQKGRISHGLRNEII